MALETTSLDLMCCEFKPHIIRFPPFFTENIVVKTWGLDMGFKGSFLFVSPKNLSLPNASFSLSVCALSWKFPVKHFWYVKNPTLFPEKNSRFFPYISFASFCSDYYNFLRVKAYPLHQMPSTLYSSGPPKGVILEGGVIYAY